MRTRGTIRLATRGSDLARRQAASVKSALEDRRYAVELVEVDTTGDQLSEGLLHRLGTTGAFVRNLDEKVIAGEVDAAVHSMKDMPTESPESLIVAGVPERADPRDVLVSPDGTNLDELPDGARVGTSSLRRRAQLLAVRPDLEVAPLRGNVDTRVEKLLAPSRHREHERRLEAAGALEGLEDSEVDEDGEGSRDDADTGGKPGDVPDDAWETVDEWFDGLAEVERRALERQPDEEYDAIVLAAAGLSRLGLDRDVHTSPLPLSQFVPSPGQGAIAVTAVDGSDASEAIHDAIDHPRTRVETTVERVILAELGGGCIAPIGVHAIVQGDQVKVRVQVLSTDGGAPIAATRDLPVRTYAEDARAFAADLADRGAAALIEAAVEDSEVDGDGDGDVDQNGDENRNGDAETDVPPEPPDGRAEE